jgi:hypothetical protein
MNERLRAPAHLAHTRIELAATLLQRGARGDAARARALLDQGQAVARELGIAHLAERARAVRDRLP